MEQNEQKIIELCQKGELKNFGELYDKYIERIYAFVFYRVQNKETAEDLTADIFMKALAKINSFKQNLSFQAWLYCIARNTVIDHYRSFKATENIEDCWSMTGARDVGKVAGEMKYDLQKIVEFMQQFSFEQREMITLRVWDGLAYGEIAEVMNKSEAAVKMSVKRGLSKIQQKFGDSGLGLLIILALIKN